LTELCLEIKKYLKGIAVNASTTIYILQYLFCIFYM